MARALSFICGMLLSIQASAAPLTKDASIILNSNSHYTPTVYSGGAVIPLPGALGNFDPSIVNDLTAPARMIYTAVNPSVTWSSQNPQTETIRAANSSNLGATWADDGVVIADITDTPATGYTWTNEVSTVIWDSNASKYKMFWSHYLIQNNVANFADSWIGYKEATTLDGLMSATEVKFLAGSGYNTGDNSAGAPNYPPVTGAPEIQGNTFNTALSTCLAFTEPGAYIDSSFNLYLAVSCEESYNGAVGSRPVLFKCAVTCAVGTSGDWAFVGTIMAEAQAKGYSGAYGMTASDIYYQSGQAFISLTPITNAGGNYNGCFIFPFADINTPSLIRPVSYIHGNPGSFFGACSYQPVVSTVGAMYNQGGGSPEFQIYGLGSVPQYTGPLDVVSSATVCVSLRGCSSSYSTGSHYGINVRRASDNATEDVLITATGNLDIANAVTWAGADATATCSTTGSSTSLVCTGASSTPHAHDPVVGAGLAQPTYLVSCGTFTSGAGTCTMNVARTIASEPITFQVAMYVTEMYDQTGNGHNCIQATSANQFQLLPYASTGLPQLHGITANSEFCTLSYGVAQPDTISVVAERDAGFTTAQTIILAAVAVHQQLYYNSSTNQVGVYAGSSNVNVTASDSAWHAIQYVANGASSNIQVDNTNSGSVNPGSAALDSSALIGASGGSNSYLSGGLQELIIWPSALNSTQEGNICHNQYTYFATATSC